MQNTNTPLGVYIFKSAMNKSAKYECTCRGIHMLFFIRYVTNKLGTHKLNIEEMFQDP